MGAPELFKGRYAGFSEGKLRQVLGGDYELFSWSDIPGATYAPHSHPHDEYIVVLSGAIDFLIAGKRYSVAEGDALLLPANTVHEAVNEGRVPVRYFICT